MSCRCDMPAGSKACHCRRCCLTFSGISAFDRHIVGGLHRQPSERGLVLIRPDVWGWPGNGRIFPAPRLAGASGEAA